MFHWLRDYRRAEVRKRRFPPEWDAFLYANVVHFRVLDEGEREELRAMVQVFLDEKLWEGCGGLELTDELRVTIAAQACLLQLGLPHDYYRNVESILVYPTTIMIPERQTGVFEHVVAPVEPSRPIVGQAFTHGSVILVWDAVLRGARHPEQGHNVVYHEFAHKLDMLDGAADGTPPLADREQLADWISVCTHEFVHLQRTASQGHKSFVDAYGARNAAEFFAVATEEFFDRPVTLHENAHELYHILSNYYRQDPAERVKRSLHSKKSVKCLN